MSARLLAIGDLTADHILGPLGALPGWGEEREVTSLDIRLGGNTGNLVLAAAALGLQVTAIGPIGADENGRFVEAALEQVGLSTEGLKRCDDVGTSLTVALVREDGERLYVTYPGALKRLESVLATTQFPTANIAIFSGWCQPPRVDLDVLRNAAKRLRANGTKLAIDLAWSAESWNDCDRMIEALALMDIVLLNMDEAQALTDCADGRGAVARLAGQLGAGVLLVVKDGARGAWVSAPGGTVTTVPALPLSTPVMAVGAGDAFNAGLLWALLIEGPDPIEAAQFACAFAGYWLVHGRAASLTPEAVRFFARSLSDPTSASEVLTC
jgi:sugar/nucleoside kinase (ribokinase family)